MRNLRPISDRCDVLGRGVLFLYLLLVPLVFSSATLEAFETPKVALLHLTALALAGLGVVAWTEWRAGLSFWRDPVVFGGLMFAFSTILSTVRSISPRTSFFGANDSLAGLTTVLSYGVLLLAARGFIRTAEQAWRLIFAVVSSAGIASVYALVQVMRLDPYPWGSSSSIGDYVRPFATLGHANFLGGFLAMALPLAVALCVRSRGVWRGIAIANCALITAIIGLTLSRGAWITLAALASIGAGFLFRVGQRRRVGILLVVAGSVAFLGLWSSMPAFRTGLTERLKGFANSAGRVELWRSGLAMARTHPATGVGLDAYPLAFGQHRPGAYWAHGWNETPTRAHNEIIHILATQGVTGLLAVTAFVVGCSFAACRAWRSGPDRTLAAAAIGGSLAFAIQGQFSFTVAAIGSLAAVLAGLLSRLGEVVATPVEAVARPFWSIRLSTGFVVCCLAWWGVLTPLQSNAQCRSADLACHADPMTALHEYEAAVVRSPERDLFWFKLGQVARAAARSTNDPEQRMGLNRRALEAQARGIQLVPASPTHRAHFARLLSDLATELSLEVPEVLGAFQQALLLDPDNPMLLADAGHAAWSMKRFDRARRWLARGLELDPQQANLRALLGTVAMTVGQFEEAERHYERAASCDWHGNEDGQMHSMTVWAACLVHLKRPVSAEQVLQVVLNHRPNWANARYTLGYVHEMLGRKSDAIAAYRLVIAAAPQHDLARQAGAGIRRLSSPAQK